MEVTIRGDESVDHNGSTRGSPSAYLNTVQSNGFEHPSRSGFVEWGQKSRVGKRNNTHCVLFCALH